MLAPTSQGEHDPERPLEAWLLPCERHDHHMPCLREGTGLGLVSQAGLEGSRAQSWPARGRGPGGPSRACLLGPRWASFDKRQAPACLAPRLADGSRCRTGVARGLGVSFSQSCRGERGQPAAPPVCLSQWPQSWSQPSAAHGWGQGRRSPGGQCPRGPLTLSRQPCPVLLSLSSSRAKQPGGNWFQRSRQASPQVRSSHSRRQ